jgi:putative ABC transport system permease protein
VGLSLLPARFRTEHGAAAFRMAATRVREETGGRRLWRAGRELADLLGAALRLRRPLRTSHRFSSGSNPGGTMRDGLWLDLRHAAKALRRSRSFLVVALGTLSAGLALCVAVMVVVNAYLVRGLPYPEADRLHWVRFTQPSGPLFDGLERLDWSRLDDVFEHPISWDLDMFSLRGAPYPEAVQGTWVTPGYIEGFGIRPAQGRGFQPADYQPGGAQVALISHRLWQTRFDGAADVVGRRLDVYVSDRPGEPQILTVIGVLPADLWHLNAFTEILAPLRASSYPYMARLRRGVSPAAAVDRIRAFVAGSDLTLPDGWRVELASAHDSYVQTIRPLLLSLATATALVLLIACANVAVLFTLRATSRTREVALRKALGASARRVSIGLASEAALLGFAATVIGLLAAHLLLGATAPILERYLGRSAPGGAGALAIDGRTAVGGLLAGAAVTLMCCVAQLWAAGRASLALALGGAAKGATAAPAQRRAHGALIAVEVAVCLTLLAGASLTIRSSLRMLGVEMGLDTTDVRVGRFNLDQRVYPDAASRIAFYDRALADMAALPGARGVAITNSWPLQSALSRDVGRDELPRSLSTRAAVVAVSDAYFETVGIAREDGRAFTAADRAGAERVAVVSRTLAARLWPGRRAIGERLLIGPVSASTAPSAAPPIPVAVVGVVEDVRHTHTDDDLADVYVPMLQHPSAAAFLYVRASGDPAALERGLRDALARIDPDLALAVPRPLGDLLDQQRAGTRLLTSLLVVFAGFAAILALVGIHGVIAFAVRQRGREIAVRIAIGATRADVTRLFLRHGAVVLALGLALGVGGAMLLARVLQSQLFGVDATDPISMTWIAVAFAACGLAAMAWPARRAAMTDPASALKD